MAPDETEKPIELTPEAPKAEATVHVAPPAEEPMPVAEPVAAPATPPADPVKQMGEAAHQASASIDKSLSGMKPQDRFMLILIVSIIVPWLGDILNGQVMKGVAVVAVLVVLLFLGPFTFMLSGLLWGLVHLVAAIDPIVIANRINKGEKFGDWDFFMKPAPPAA